MCYYIYDFISLGWGFTTLRWLIEFLKTSIFPRLNQHGRILFVNKQYWAAILGSRWGQKLALWILQMHWKSIIYTGATNTTIKKMRYLIYPLKVAINRVTEPKQLINITANFQTAKKNSRIYMYMSTILISPHILF